MTTQIHNLASCEADTVGDGSCVGPFVSIAPGCKLGQNCDIQAHVVMQANCALANGVSLAAGVKLAEGTQVGKNVQVGANTTIGSSLQGSLPVSIEDDVTVGENAIIPAGVTLGQAAVVKPGTVVNRSIPPKAIVEGNPAAIVGYIDTIKEEKTLQQKDYATESTEVSGVVLHKLPFIDDIRGNLSVGEFQQHIPFDVKRFFLVFDVPSAETRGEHAHKECHQFLLCVKGRVSFVADDGKSRQEFVLDKPYEGIHVPPMVWGIQYNYSEDAVLLVLASEHYDSDDYIRHYDEFLASVK